jgi:uncharacterized protein YgiB involved in biofilm formation
VDARRKRRCSTRVALVLLGTISLAGCEQEPEQRHVYKSLRDCTEEWGIEKCDPADNRHPTGYYYGPSYRGSTYSGSHMGGSGAVRPPGSRAVGSVSRGGFGSSASAHGGGS